MDAVVREGGGEASSGVIPWKLAKNPAEPVVSAVSRSPPSLTIASISDISKLASAFSSAADAQTAQITTLMAAMMDQRLPESNSSARRNKPRKENNQRGKKTEKPKS